MKAYVYPSKKKVGKKKTTPPTIDNDEPDEIYDSDECEEDTDTPDDEFELEDEDEDVGEEFYMGSDYDESDSDGLDSNSQEEQMQFGSVPRQSNFMPSFSSASEPSTSKVPPKKKPKFTLAHGWRLAKQRLLDINMVRSPSQPNTPG